MSTLTVTKTRLALLQAIDDGAVTENYGIFPTRDWSQLDNGPGATPRYRTVTKAVHALRLAGWVRVGDRVYDSYKSPRLWILTPAGRAVLDDGGDT